MAPVILSLILALIAIIGQIINTYFQVNKESKRTIRNTFFQKRLEIYTKISELSWEGYSVKINHIDEKNDVYPRAYDTFEDLRRWLNSFVEFMDKNIFFLDTKTYKQFESLNHKILFHLSEIRKYRNNDKIDIETRNIGRNNVNEIQMRCKLIIDSSREYMIKTYKLNLEQVI